MTTMIYEGLPLTSQRITPGNTRTAIGANIIKYKEQKLHIDGYGTTALAAGNLILGNTSAATGVIVQVGSLSGGTVAGGDAVCYIWLKSVVGVFQNNETLTVEAGADMATVDGVLINITKDEYIYPEYYGLTARELWLQAETNDQRVCIDGTLPGQTSKIGVMLAKGSSMTIKDATAMSQCRVVDAVAGTAGYTSVIALF